MKHIKKFNESITDFTLERCIEIMELCFIDISDSIVKSSKKEMISSGIFDIKYDFKRYNLTSDPVLIISIFKKTTSTNSPDNWDETWVGFNIEEIRDPIEKMIDFLGKGYRIEYNPYNEFIEEDCQGILTLEDIPYNPVGQLDIDIYEI